MPAKGMIGAGGEAVAAAGAAFGIDMHNAVLVKTHGLVRAGGQTVRPEALDAVQQAHTQPDDAFGIRPGGVPDMTAQGHGQTVA